MKNKKLIYTTLFTALLFLFIGICIYSLYCYAYYNRHQEIIYIDKVNQHKYDFLYNHLDYSIPREQFNREMTFLFDRSYLEDIYNLYYKDKDIYSSLESFLETFYFGNTISISDIEFSSKEKTSLFKRRKLFYHAINLTSTSGRKTSLSLFYNISFHIDDGAILSIDGENIECKDGVCPLDSFLGGLHSLTYQVGNTIYYGLFTLNKDNAVISVSTLESLVVLKKEELVNATYDIPYGNYTISSCNLEDKHYCPAINKSYLKILSNGTFSYYTYVNYSKAGDYCEGIYKIDGKFLTLICNKHVHKVFDYDTQIGTDVVSETDVQYNYKINKDLTIENKDYTWNFYR